MKKRVALITGSSRGIGRAIALRFAKEGYDLIINGAHNKEALYSLKTHLETTYSITCHAYLLDVSNYDAVEKMIKEVHENYDAIDVLVNNAGVAHLGLLTDMSEEEWDHVMNTNSKSLFNLTKFIVPSMVKSQTGSIINISSMWGISGASCEVAYSASKGAMNAFTKALAKELAPSHIRVNAIACGAIETEMNAWLDEEERLTLENDIPMGRMGKAEEVASLVYSLTQDTIAYLTGQVIPMDGGYL